MIARVNLEIDVAAAGQRAINGEHGLLLLWPGAPVDDVRHAIFSLYRDKIARSEPSCVTFLSGGTVRIYTAAHKARGRQYSFAYVSEANDLVEVASQIRPVVSA